MHLRGQLLVHVSNYVHILETTHSWCEGAVELIVSVMSDPVCTLTSAPPTGLCVMLLSAVLSAAPVPVSHAHSTLYKFKS